MYSFLVMTVIMGGVLTMLAENRITIKQPQNIRQIIENIYTDLPDGYCISDGDRSCVQATGGAETYGEITFEGVERLMQVLAPTKDDVFYDFGSGIGKMAIHVALASPVTKSVGIEMSSARHQSAEQAYRRLITRYHLEAPKAIQFIQGDILKIDSSDATIIYIASTCFTEVFMKQFIQKLSHYKKGLRIVTLSVLPENEVFELVTSRHLPMTWCEENNMYLYRLK